MAALNHAVMIPGLIIVVIVLWAWMPIALVVWCLRRASGARNDEELRESGHVPHPGFQKPPAYYSPSYYYSDDNTYGDHRDPRAAMVRKHNVRLDGRDRQQKRTEESSNRYGRDAHAHAHAEEDRRRREREERRKAREHREEKKKKKKEKAKEEYRKERGMERRLASREENGESLLVQPETLATRESGRSRRLMDESRGYPSQQEFY